MTKGNWVVLCAFQVALVAAGGVRFAASAQSITSNLPTMASNNYQDVGNDPGVVLSLNLIREMPSVLDDQKLLLKSFIFLNSCHDPEIGRQLNDQFDYPQIAAFYKAHATQILAGAPSTITVTLGGGELGQYDATRSGFPFRAISNYEDAAHRRQAGLWLDHLSFSTGGSVCGGMSFSGYSDAGMTSAYIIDIAPIAFDEIPMSEAAARHWVGSLMNPGMTEVTIQARIEIEHQAPKIVPASPGRDGTVIFTGRVVGITVVGELDHTVLANLNSRGEVATNGSEPPVMGGPKNEVWNAAQSGTRTDQPPTLPGLSNRTVAIGSTISCKTGLPAVIAKVKGGVSSGAARGMLVKKTTPVYPPDAMAAGIQGTVVLDAIVEPDGKVSTVTVDGSPSPSLTVPAIEAVCTWRYRPYLYNGTPVAMRVPIDVTF